MSKHRSAALGSNPLQAALLPGISLPPVTVSSSALFPFGQAAQADSNLPTTQYQRVESIMADGYWRTIADISAEIRKRFAGHHDAETAISARIREMRRHGWNVDSERSRSNSSPYQYRAIKMEAAHDRAH
jgi:hypothetical protein